MSSSCDERRLVRLRHLAWFGDSEFALEFPEAWRVEVHHSQPAREMSDLEIEMKVAPIVATIARQYSLSRGRIAIICDDISRPTPTDRIVPILVRMLGVSQVRSSDISIIVAGGTHAAMGVADLTRKLSEHIVASYYVAVHDPHRQLVSLGRTRSGTPILVNEHVERCAYKIGVGGVYPHSLAGFGGGAKLALGVCGFKTITRLHYLKAGSSRAGSLDSEFRSDLVEISQRIGIDMSVNVVLNESRRIAGVFAGRLSASHRDAVDYCRSIHTVPAPNDAEVVVVNTYPFDTTLLFSKKSCWPIRMSAPNALNVIIGTFPGGKGYHGLHPVTRTRIEYMRHKFKVLSQLPAHAVVAKSLSGLSGRLRKRRASGPRPKQVYYNPQGTSSIDSEWGVRFDSWPEILGRVRCEFANQSPRVVVYPCPGLQFVQCEDSTDSSVEE